MIIIIRKAFTCNDTVKSKSNEHAMLSKSTQKTCAKVPARRRADRSVCLGRQQPAREAGKLREPSESGARTKKMHQPAECAISATVPSPTVPLVGLREVDETCSILD